MLRQRLIELFLIASTEYAELLLGVLSTFTGIWLFMPSAHTAFSPHLVMSLVPEFWGLILTVSGLLKLDGVFYQRVKSRRFSCLFAAMIWLMLTLSFSSCDQRLAAPLTLVLCLFNALIFIKLRVVQCNNS